MCGASYDVLEIKDPISILSNSKPIKKDSEHIFFDLPKKIDTLREFLNKSNLQTPIKNKLKEWLSDDLKKWDISRDEPYFGFKIPDEINKYFYVWVDAPIGYITATKKFAQKRGLDWKKYWKNNELSLIHI